MNVDGCEYGKQKKNILLNYSSSVHECLKNTLVGLSAKLMIYV